MTRYAAPLDALVDAWSTPAGAALVESLADPAVETAETTTIRGDDCVLLDGPEPRVAALVAGLIAQGVAVYEEVGDDDWLRVRAAPAVTALPDEESAFDEEEAALA